MLDLNVVRHDNTSGPAGIEEAVAAVVVVEGQESCRVGFLPKHYCKVQSKFIGKIVQVCELYDKSESSHKRARSHRNMGIAACVFMESNPNHE